jgi:hypothetical protein
MYRLFHPSLAQVLLLEVKDKLEANSDCGTQSSFPSISEWNEIGEIKLSSLILHPTVFFKYVVKNVQCCTTTVCCLGLSYCTIIKQSFGSIIRTPFVRRIKEK